MAKPKPEIPAMPEDEILIQVTSPTDEFGRVTMIIWWYDPERQYYIPGALKNWFPEDDPRYFTHGQVYYTSVEKALDYWEGRTTYQGYRGEIVPFIDPGFYKVRVQPYEES